MLIGDVARRSGVSARMLRHYDALGLVRPSGRSGTGYREYSDADTRRIFHVESLRSLGLSLRDIGRALDDPGFATSGLVDELIRQTEARLRRETELLTRLRRVGDPAPADWEDVLSVVALLQDLGSVSAGKRQSAALSSTGLAPDALAEAVLREPAPNVAGALRWALAQSDGDGLALLRQGLDSPDPQVRRRAVETIAEIPHEDATAVLHDALASADDVVRRCAALALGARGVVDAIPTLIDMVIAGTNDVDAADALGGLASGETADGIVSRLVERAVESQSRLRVTQGLADIPGAAATRALTDLTHDEDRSVALTAQYILGRRLHS